jgi:hypothetical protein
MTIELCKKCDSEAVVYELRDREVIVECMYHYPIQMCDNQVSAKTKSEAIRLWNAKQRGGNEKMV